MPPPPSAPPRNAAPPAAPDPALRAAAVEHLRARRWRDASDILLGFTSPDLPTQMQCNLARNMAALQTYRPELYAMLCDCPAGSTCRVAPVEPGWLTIYQIVQPGKPVSLSPAGNPRVGLQEHIAAIRDALKTVHAFALCGLGDGHLARWLADPANAAGPGADIGVRRAIYVIEPDPAVALFNLMAHDFSGPRGPIEQRNVLWFVGPDWHERFRSTLESDAYLPVPAARMAQGLDGRAISDRLQAFADELAREDAHRACQVAEHYARLPREELAAAIAGELPRPPRVLVFTSRFSSVLQHSARDAADGFRRLGWETRLLIEPTDHHSITRRAIQRALHEFRPDLAFAIDHLRYECPIIPKELPYACWIQDDFDNLTSPEAGASVGVRDYVLTCAGWNYARDFGYPARQCIYLEKLTRVPARPASWRSDGDDLAFVSNASKTPDALLAQLIAGARNDSASANLLEACGRRILGLYERGEHLATAQQIRRLFDEEASRRGYAPPTPATREVLVGKLINNFNNTLYRQQALGWVAELADRLGLKLGLYGNGWEAHPRFGKHGRGPVAYGEALESLTRRSKINLQILPYACVHQRLLDGLVAGGFFLIREHPIDTLPHRLAEFVRRDVPPGATSIAEVRDTLSPAARETLDRLLADLAELNDFGDVDPIEVVRRYTGEGVAYMFERLPRFEEVAFRDAATLEARVTRFLADEPARGAVADAQRMHVESHYTYAAGLARVARRIAGLIRSEEASPL